jgi:hypothetical protein
MLTFTLRFTINAATCFGLTKPSSLPYDNSFVKPKHVGAFIVNLNVFFNILKAI